MGPRSYERGNTCTGVLLGSILGILQWGRVRTNAEISRYRYESLWIDLLQWGRVRTNAEMTSYA